MKDVEKTNLLVYYFAQKIQKYKNKKSFKKSIDILF